jgi:uncharacterized protein HemY
MSEPLLRRGSVGAPARKGVLQLDPTFDDAHLALGKLYFEQPRYLEAIRVLESAVRLNPASGAACYCLSQAYQRAGNPEKAQAMSELFLKRQKPTGGAGGDPQKGDRPLPYTLK